MSLFAGDFMSQLYTGIATNMNWNASEKQRQFIGNAYDTPGVVNGVFSCGFGATVPEPTAQAQVVGLTNFWRRWHTDIHIHVDSVLRVAPVQAPIDDLGHYRILQQAAELSYTQLSRYLLYNFAWGTVFVPVWSPNPSTYETVTFSCTEFRIDPKSNHVTFIMTAKVYWREQLPNIFPAGVGPFVTIP